MKLSKTYLALSAALFVLNFPHAMADFNADVEIILNWGEKTFPQYLPVHDETKTLDIWRYRYYKATNLYVGANTQDNGIYVLSGAPGAQPGRFGLVADVLKTINNSASQACDQTQLPPGFSYSQSGNVVNVTTNGQCVVAPKKPICTPTGTANGLSVLSTANITKYELHGITFNDPKLKDFIEPEIQKATKVQSCIINAPETYVSQQINLDLCLDVTDQLSSFEAMLANIATVTKPVTMTLQGNVINETTVNGQAVDCFTSTASNIVNALTKEVWIKDADGNFVKN